MERSGIVYVFTAVPVVCCIKEIGVNYLCGKYKLVLFVFLYFAKSDSYLISVDIILIFFNTVV